MATVQFENSTFTPINGGNAFTTHFYKNEGVDLVSGVVTTVFTDVSDSVAMWTDQPTKLLDLDAVRSVEVYTDNSESGTAGNGLANGIAPFEYLGTDAFPTGDDIKDGVVYVRATGSAIQAQCSTTRNDLIIVVVTD